MRRLGVQCVQPGGGLENGESLKRRPLDALQRGRSTACPHVLVSETRLKTEHDHEPDWRGSVAEPRLVHQEVPGSIPGRARGGFRAQSPAGRVQEAAGQ